MEFGIRQYQVRGVTVLELTGTVNDANVGTVARQVLEHVNRLEAVRPVVDNRQLVRNVSLASIYFLMQELRPLTDPTRQAALVERPEARAFAQFHHTAAQNAGVRFEVYFDLDEAVDVIAGAQDGRSATQTMQSDPPSA